MNLAVYLDLKTYILLQSLADHEQRWHREVLDHRQENVEETPPYFHDYHLQEVLKSGFKL
jgi:hypothetical protein